MVDNIGPGKPLIEPISTPAEQKSNKAPLREKQGIPSFTDFLDKAQEDQQLKISAHARQRMESRSIKLDESDMREISAAVEKAGNKGARSSLLLYGDVALIASVTNRTIITAIDETEAQEHIFTGIDSAVIVK